MNKNCKTERCIWSDEDYEDECCQEETYCAPENKDPEDDTRQATPEEVSIMASAAATLDNMLNTLSHYEGSSAVELTFFETEKRLLMIALERLWSDIEQGKISPRLLPYTAIFDRVPANS